MHTILRDQRTIAGVGRGYSDDILHASAAVPDVAAREARRGARTALIAAVHDILGDALEVERRRTGGLPTKIGDHSSCTTRSGEPCPRCGADLRRVSYEDYEVTYCPDCQTGGKVLADRRLSRLLR